MEKAKGRPVSAMTTWRRRLAAVVSDPPRSWQTIRSRYLHWLYLDLNRDPDRTLIVAGSARSGTTWVAEAIDFDHSHRIMFEPFRPDRARVARSFGTRRYLRPGDGDRGRSAAAGAILSGRDRGRWTDQMNRRALARRRIVKDVWANLLLGWIHERFPRIPIVFVVRHPCAVVSSQLLLSGWDWKVDPAGFLRQPDLVADHLGPLQHAVAAAASPFDRHLVTWCVENLVPLRQFTSGRIHVVPYERLCTDPAGEAERLLAFLGRPFDPRILDTLRRPSRAARGHSAPVTGRGLVDGWVERVSDPERRRAGDLVAAFGLDALYGWDPLPNPEWGGWPLADLAHQPQQKVPG